MPSDEISNKQSVNTWLRLNLTLVGCGRAWKLLRTTKGNPDASQSLPDELNAFYACFEASNTEACMRAPAVLDDCVITLSVADVNKTFKTGQHLQSHWARRNTRTCTQSMRKPTVKCHHWHFKPLPDRVCNTYMFQADHHSPCAQGTKLTCLNDYRPVAFMSVAIWSALKFWSWLISTASSWTP